MNIDLDIVDTTICKTVQICKYFFGGEQNKQTTTKQQPEYNEMNDIVW